MKTMSSEYSKRMTHLAEVSDILHTDGFAHFDFSLLMDRRARRLFSKFQERICRDLPVDEYDVSGTRFRLFARYLYSAGMLELTRWGLHYDEAGNPKTEYLQTGTFHPDPKVADKRRLFPSLSEKDGLNPALQNIISLCATIAINAGVLNPDALFLVGTHWVRLSVSDPAKLAAASPNKLHRDGEIVTVGILLKRRNCVGGGNLIAVPDAAGKRPDQLLRNEKLKWLMLSDPFDAWIIDDRRVSHHVEEIALGPDGSTAERDILLVDFLPQASLLSDVL